MNRVQLLDRLHAAVSQMSEGDLYLLCVFGEALNTQAQAPSPDPERMALSERIRRLLDFFDGRRGHRITAALVRALGVFALDLRHRVIDPKALEQAESALEQIEDDLGDQLRDEPRNPPGWEGGFAENH